MEQQPPTTTILHQEELIYLLHLLKIPTLAGIAPHSTNGMNPYQFVALMNAAERSLRERDLLTTGAGGDCVIENELFDMLSFCARPDHVVLVSRNTLDANPRRAVYYLSKRLRIKHDVYAGEHRFVALTDETRVFDELFGMITAYEDVKDGIRGSAHYQVPITLLLALSRIRTTDELDHETLLRQLINEGLSETGAAHLVHLVRHEMIANTTITAEQRRTHGKSNGKSNGISRIQNGAPAPIFNLMQTIDAWWLAIPAAAPQTVSTTYTLTALGTDALYTRLNDLLQPFCHAC
jgi:hypothetical protein